MLGRALLLLLLTSHGRAAADAALPTKAGVTCGNAFAAALAELATSRESDERMLLLARRLAALPAQLPRPAQPPRCDELAETALVEWAVRWAKDAQARTPKDAQAVTSKDYQRYRLASAAMTVYVDAFPHGKHVYSMSFYRAEMLFAAQDFCTAAPLYEGVVKMEPDPKSRYVKEAAYAAVIAWKNCVGADLNDNVVFCTVPRK